MRNNFRKTTGTTDKAIAANHDSLTQDIISHHEVEAILVATLSVLGHM